MKKDFKNNYFFDLKPKANIYRYTTLNRLFQMFDEKKLVLVQPSMWDDPFENILSKVVYYDGRDKVSLRGITDNFVGQCWTKSIECDGLWRNYTNMNKGSKNVIDGVKITTKVDKLFNYVANCNNDKFCGLNTFIGNVQYDKDQNIIDFFKKTDLYWIADTSGKNPAKTLFLKRNEFKYENEVRVVKSIEKHLNDNKIMYDESNSNRMKYYVDIDPFDLITSVVFSPMMNDQSYEENKKRLMKLGFDERKISRSKLYDLFTEPIIINKN